MGEYISDDAREELAKYNQRQIIEAMEIVDHTRLINVSLQFHTDQVKNAESTDPDDARDTDDAYWLASNPDYKEAMNDLADDFVHAVLAVIKMKATQRKADAIHDKIRRDIRAIAEVRQGLTGDISVADFLAD